MGPTAVGKTDLALELHQQLTLELPLDIISVDSTMVYKGFNIGTGKPSADVLTAIPHKIVDIREAHEVYSVADFCADAKQHIAQAHSKGKIPLLVGGTMMYFKALQLGLASLPSSDPAIRTNLTEMLTTKGLEHLYKELLIIDPTRASHIEPNDTQRIMRALEIYYISGYTMSELLEKDQQTIEKPSQDYDFINIIISSDDRAYIHNNIAQRFNSMLAAGFIEEVETLLDNKSSHADLPAFRSCGYKQIRQYLIGDYSKSEMIERSIISTRQLAKRQLTWLRWFLANDPLQQISWYDVKKGEYKMKIINSLLAFDLLKGIV